MYNHKETNKHMYLSSNNMSLGIRLHCHKLYIHELDHMSSTFKKLRN